MQLTLNSRAHIDERVVKVVVVHAAQTIVQGASGRMGKGDCV